MAAVPRNTQAQPPSLETPTTTLKRLYGTYQDGKWWCNCQPNRRPAALREVTKDTPNKGKFFWTCPIYNGCNFFLFRDEARVRETGLKTTTILPEDQDLPPRPKTPTLSQPKLTSYGVQVTPGKRRHSRSEIGSEDDGDEDVNVDDQQQPQQPKSAGSTTMVRDSYPTRQEMARALRTPESAKRQRHAARPALADNGGDSSDEFSDLAVDSDDERQLAALTDASAKKASRGKGTAADAVVTPMTGTRTVEGLPTPSSVARTLFPTSERERRKSVTFEPVTPSSRGKVADLNEDGEDDDNGSALLLQDSPATVANSSTASTATLASSPQPDPSAEILSVLSAHGVVSPSAHRTVRDILAVSARRARGVEKSRDLVREELRREKARNAKLQEKIAALEDKLRVRSRSVTNLKAGLMELYGEN